MVKDKHELIYADHHREEEPLPRSGRLAIVLGTGAAVVLMLLAAVALSITIQGKGEGYQAALTLLRDKQYANAAEALEQLEGFRDSEALLEQLEQQGADYARALKLLEEGSYEDAAAVFLALGDYADSAQWASWGVTYRRCTDAMSRLGAARQADPKTWDALADTLESLGNVADAPALARECREMAESLRQEEP